MKLAIAHRIAISTATLLIALNWTFPEAETTYYYWSPISGDEFLHADPNTQKRLSPWRPFHVKRERTLFLFVQNWSISKAAGLDDGVRELGDISRRVWLGRM